MHTVVPLKVERNMSDLALFVAAAIRDRVVTDRSPGDGTRRATTLCITRLCLWKARTRPEQGSGFWNVRLDAMEESE